MRVVFYFIFFSLLPLFGIAQCDSTQWAKEGTFQVIKINGTVEVANEFPKTPLTNNQLCIIESLRDEHQFVFYQLDSYTRIRIFPRQMPEKLEQK